jgi:hypothetical protein
MENSVIDLLQKCTVSIGHSVKDGIGTGFFVAPGLILTCAHVIKPILNDLDNAVVMHERSEIKCNEIVEYDEAHDLAVLKLSKTVHPCVRFEDFVQVRDEFYVFGYTRNYICGESITLLYEGPAFPKEEIEWLKFKSGQFKPGISGSPLLSIRTSRVAGIVKRTRDKKTDLGGYGIPVKTIYKVLPWLQKLNKKFHKSNSDWINLAKENPKGKPHQKINFENSSKKTDEEIFERFKNKHSLLNAASMELTIPIESAIIASSIPAKEIAEFLRILIRKADRSQVYPITFLALRLMDKSNRGADIIDFVFENIKLAFWEVDGLGSAMITLKKEKALIWAHKQLTSRIQDDIIYNSFITKHFKTIEGKCYNDILSYLLKEDRGPGKFNVDTFAFLIENGKIVTPFIEKWIFWIEQGRFDGKDAVDNFGPELLYSIFNEILPSKYELFEPIVNAAHNYVYYLFKRGSSKDIDIGMSHLIGILLAKYRHAGVIKEGVWDRKKIRQFTQEQRLLFFAINQALDVLTQLLERPDDKTLKIKLNELINKM